MNTKRPSKPKKQSNSDKGGASYIDRRQSSCYATVALAHGRKSDAQPESYRNAAQLTGRESLLPLAIVITLFVLWGFTSGLGEVLNKKFQLVLHLSKAKSTGLQVAFYGAYAVGPLTYAGWIVRRFGYRWSFITGLCIFGIGTLLFWPSAKFRSFGGFCGASFVVGSGLSTLEASAIPFVAICGPPKYSEIRLNLAQAFQSTAAVAALVLASYVILDDIPSKNASLGAQTPSLDTIQWLYLGIAAFIFLLAFGLYFAPIPEITDEDLQEQTHQTAEEHGDDTYEELPLRKQHKLFFGVFASFCFTGSQVSVATFFINYAVEVNPALSDKDAAHRLAIAQAVFAAGRFAASVILIKVKARHLLMGSVTLVVAFLGAAIGAKGDAGIAMIILEFFAKSCVFPTMFTLTLRGLGKHTKRGASWLVASVASGIVFAPAMGAAADAMGTQKALVVPLVAMSCAATYPIYLNFFKSKELDEDWASDEQTDQSKSRDDLEMSPIQQRTKEQERIQEGFEKFCK